MKQIPLAAIVLGFCLVLSVSSRAASKRPCLEYEPDVVTLSGKISSHLEYGAPNYGEDPAHDAKEKFWYLDLDKPICVNAKEEDSPDMEGEKSVRRLQIVFIGRDYPKGRWVGSRATITGTLFHADSPHHHTKVLVTPESITKAGTPTQLGAVDQPTAGVANPITLAQTLAKRNPPDQGNASQMNQRILELSGLPGDAIYGRLTPEQKQRFLDAIKNAGGWTPGVVTRTGPVRP